MTAEILLSKLDKVQRIGDGRWKARCPAHDDKSPSLYIKETGDRVLLHCFSECHPSEVLGAVGLCFADLFPPNPDRMKSDGPDRIPAQDVLKCLAFESLVVLVSAKSVLAGKKFDSDRLTVAVSRIQFAADFAGARND